MPPLLAGFAYSRLGRNGSRDVDLKTSGLPIAPCGNLFLRRRISGIEAAHETHLKERSRLVDGVRHRRAFGETERRRFLAERRFLRLSGGDDDLPVRMRRTDNDHGIDVAVGDQVLSGAIGLGHVELLRDLVGERAIAVGDGDDGRFGNSTREIADVHFAKPAQTDDPHLQPDASLRRHGQGC